MQSLFVDGRWIKKEATIVFTSHLLADLNHLLTHILFMRHGELHWQADWVYTQNHCRIMSLDDAQALGTQPIFQNKKQALIDLNLLTEAQQSALRQSLPAPTLDTVFNAINE
jgi:ABC-type uncharacterized transport system ATPase subunit